MTGNIEKMAQALSDCIDALEDEGHSDNMAASLCEGGQVCWKCEAVRNAHDAISTIRRDPMTRSDAIEAMTALIAEMGDDDPLEGCYEDAHETRNGKGGIYSLGWYLAYSDGAVDANLDGQFTARDLLAIAIYMLKHP